MNLGADRTANVGGTIHGGSSQRAVKGAQPCRQDYTGILLFSRSRQNVDPPLLVSGLLISPSSRT